MSVGFDRVCAGCFYSYELTAMVSFQFFETITSEGNIFFEQLLFYNLLGNEKFFGLVSDIYQLLYLIEFFYVGIYFSLTSYWNCSHLNYLQHYISNIRDSAFFVCLTFPPPFFAKLT